MSLIILPPASSAAVTNALLAQASTAIVSRLAGTMTWTTRFQLAEAKVCTGARFYAKNAVNETATFSLWNAAGTLLAQKATASGAVNGSGLFSVTFDTPQSLSSDVFYFVGVYVPSFHYSYGGSTINNAWIQSLGAMSAGAYVFDARWQATAVNTFPNASDVGSPSARGTVEPRFA